MIGGRVCGGGGSESFLTFGARPLLEDDWPGGIAGGPLLEDDWPGGIAGGPVIMEQKKRKQKESKSGK